MSDADALAQQHTPVLPPETVTEIDEDEDMSDLYPGGWDADPSFIACIAVSVMALGTLAVLALFVIILGTLAWPLFVAQILPFLFQNQSDPLVRSTAVAVLVLLGIVLYHIKRRFRTFYGLAEIAVGTTLCWQGLGVANPDNLAVTLILAGGVYVIVRGLESFFEGRKKQTIFGEFLELASDFIRHVTNSEKHTT